MKLFLCIIIVFFCGAVGIGYKNKIYQKYQLFSEINKFLQFISVKIAFFQDIYADFLKNFINTNQLKYENFFDGLQRNIEMGDFSREKCFENLKNINLTKEEELLIYDIFKSIGTTDLDSQRQILRGHIEEIKQKLSELEMQKKTKGDVIGKLSICVGLVICILIY